MERNFTLFCIWFLFVGAEYAAILPSLNEYLNTFDSNQGVSYLGLVLSAFSIAEFISSPIFGRISDRNLCSTRNVLLLSTLFGIAGNVVYTLAPSPYMVIISRFFAGIGAGCQSTIFGSVLRDTEEKEKSVKLAQMMMSRQLGMILGPIYALVLLKVDFYIGSIHVTNVSAIGFFLAFLWLFYGLVLYFTYDLSKAEINSVAKSNNSNNTEDEKELKLAEENENNELNQVKEIGWKIVYKDIWRAEVITCLVACFTAMFQFSMVETLITPITAKLLNWKTFENGILFFITGIIIIAAFVILMKLTAFISDRRMLLCGFSALLIESIAIAIFLYMTQDVAVGTLWASATWFTIFFFCIVFAPFALLPQNSILSKITMKETSGFNQGMSGSVKSIAAIIGPLWISFNLSNPLLLGLGNVTLAAFSLMMVICTYPNLRSKEVLVEDDEPQPDHSTSTC